MHDDPWLHIPASDYEGHMRASGQDVALREIFARVAAEARPARVAVLGCTTGADLALLDPRVTSRAVGVDLNPRYLERAATRTQALGDRLRLICGDVATVALPDGPFELVHAALLLEYVAPDELFARAHAWLAPSGTLSLVTQEPSPELPPVSDTGYDSLRTLAERITLRTAEEVAALAATAGFALAARRTVKLPSGKQLTSSLFDKVRPSMERPRRSGHCA